MYFTLSELIWKANPCSPTNLVGLYINPPYQKRISFPRQPKEPLSIQIDPSTSNRALIDHYMHCFLSQLSAILIELLASNESKRSTDRDVNGTKDTSVCGIYYIKVPTPDLFPRHNPTKSALTNIWHQFDLPPKCVHFRGPAITTENCVNKTPFRRPYPTVLLTTRIG